MQLMPNQKVPELSLYTTGGGLFELSKASPRSFTLLVFYRGLHCPICKDYLRDLDKRLSDFFEKGVSAVAVSCDPEDRAAQSAKDWGLSERLPLASITRSASRIISFAGSAIADPTDASR